MIRSTKPLDNWAICCAINTFVIIETLKSDNFQFNLDRRWKNNCENNSGWIMMMTSIFMQMRDAMFLTQKKSRDSFALGDADEIWRLELEERTKHRNNQTSEKKLVVGCSPLHFPFTFDFILQKIFSRRSKWPFLISTSSPSRASVSSLSATRGSPLSQLRDSKLDKRCKSNGWVFTEKHNYFFCIVVRCFFCLYFMRFSFRFQFTSRDDSGFVLFLCCWRSCEDVVSIELRTIKFSQFPPRVIEVHQDTSQSENFLSKVLERRPKSWKEFTWKNFVKNLFFLKN